MFHQAAMRPTTPKQSLHPKTFLDGKSFKGSNCLHEHSGLSHYHPHLNYNHLAPANMNTKQNVNLKNIDFSIIT
jgi:hypothetical protein